MIDIENKTFNYLEGLLKTEFTSINVVGERLNAPSDFPCVSIIQEDSSTDTSTIDSGSNENCVDVMFEVNVYSNNKNKKKTECKKISAFVSDKMVELGFARTMLNPIPNIDNSIYRIVARYVGKVDKNNNIWRR